MNQYYSPPIRREPHFFRVELMKLSRSTLGKGKYIYCCDSLSMLLLLARDNEEVVRLL